ncbi:wax ester/triacylglycerol synthase family O-acyltransferase [Rhodococcus sp. NPDC058521]|uniref:WS/DGAT/MGAT family O-acyltransferase n=1 Tax=Rhodococcus sp. NPDC058521 TaxID=3346536 RepID=UPI00364F9917
MLMPMSPLDSMFLLGDAPEHPLHVGGIQIFQPPEGADARDVRDLLDSHIEDEPGNVSERFAKRPRRTLMTLGQWAWDTDSAVDLDHHFHKNALPTPGGDRELTNLCAHLHSTPLDRTRPLWEMHFIEGLRDGRFAIYTKVHHSIMDGVTAMKVLRRSLSENSEQRGMSAPWQNHPKAETNAEQRGIRVVDLPGAAVRTGRSLLGEVAGTVPALATTVSRAVQDRGGAMSLSAPRTMFNVQVSRARDYSARALPLEQLRLVAKYADATINDVVLAMSSGALRSYLSDQSALPDEPLVAMVPVSLHDRTGTEEGNAVGVLMCNLGTHLSDPIERLSTIRTCMNDGKTSLRAMSPTQVLTMSGLGAAPAGANMFFGRNPLPRPPFNLVISNIAGPSAPQYWNGAHLDALYPLSVPMHGQAMNITCTSSDDTISFGVTACRKSVPDLQSFPGRLSAELAALENAFGI